MVAVVLWRVDKEGIYLRECLEGYNGFALYFRPHGCELFKYPRFGISNKKSKETTWAFG